MNILAPAVLLYTTQNVWHCIKCPFADGSWEKDNQICHPSHPPPTNPSAWVRTGNYMHEPLSIYLHHKAEQTAEGNPPPPTATPNLNHGRKTCTMKSHSNVLTKQSYHPLFPDVFHCPTLRSPRNVKPFLHALISSYFQPAAPWSSILILTRDNEVSEESAWP